MPKSTHFHTVHDTVGTDRKFRPDDEGLYTEEKHELQASEKDKTSETTADRQPATGQDTNNED